MKVTAVIMAGGRGERFWPKSRGNYPKQFLSLTKDGETMIQKTVKRLLPMVTMDDVFVVVLFSTFLGMAQGGPASLLDFAGIPLSILLGVLLGAAAGLFLALFFETAYVHRHLVRNSMKVIVVLISIWMKKAPRNW